MSKEHTDFGYERVEVKHKADRVREVFDSVSERYDLMNDLMSLGVHRVWKRVAVQRCALRVGHRVLDVAGGTGDMALKFIPEVGSQGHVTLTDINAQMLVRGRDRVLDAGYLDGVSIAQVDAQSLPFKSNSFDCVCIAFGLRNVTDKQRALSSMHRVMKPGGKLVILEFSTLNVTALQKLYDLYSFKVLPKLGEIVADDAQSYQYLAESIRMHPSQDKLLEMMRAVGFERCDYQNLTGGIAAIHHGYKF